MDLQRDTAIALLASSRRKVHFVPLDKPARDIVPQEAMVAIIKLNCRIVGGPQRVATVIEVDPRKPNTLDTTFWSGDRDTPGRGIIRFWSDQSSPAGVVSAVG